MNLIANLLAPANVVIDLDIGSKKRLFEQAGLLFEKNNQISRSVVFDSLFTREKLGSTGLGQGIAIPHGRIKGLREAAGAFMRLDKPVPFDAPDGQPVKMLFILLVPEQATDLHLQILGQLAQMFSDRHLCARLLEAKDALQVHQLLITWTPSATPQRSATF